MKKILLLLSFGILLSCDWGATVDYIYTFVNHYKNASGYSIKILSYNNGEKYMHIIQNEATITEKLISEVTSSEEQARMISYSDSIMVIFDDAKYSKWNKWTGDTSVRNPLIGANQETIRVEKLYQEHRFTFTPEDYNNAIPCNGNCE